MKYNTARLQKFFLESAAGAYASGEKATLLVTRPWVKQFRRVGEGEFAGLVYLDEYSTNEGWSAGTTLIQSFEDPVHPLWYMHYGGWCKGDDPLVLGVLKRALLKNYERKMFFGVRGWDCYQELVEKRTLEYRVEAYGGFTDFAGSEVISEVTVDIWGRPKAEYRIALAFPKKHEDVPFWHRFSGGLLCEEE